MHFSRSFDCQMLNLQWSTCNTCTGIRRDGVHCLALSKQVKRLHVGAGESPMPEKRRWRMCCVGFCLMFKLYAAYTTSRSLHKSGFVSFFSSLAFFTGLLRCVPAEPRPVLSLGGLEVKPLHNIFSPWMVSLVPSTGDELQQESCLSFATPVFPRRFVFCWGSVPVSGWNKRVKGKQLYWGPLYFGTHPYEAMTRQP